MKSTAAILLSLLALVTTVTAAANDAEQRLVRLSVLAHSTGNLLLEQLILRRLMNEASSDIGDAARHRLAENALVRGDYAETIRLLNAGDGSADPKSPPVRRDRVLLGEAYRRSGDIPTATQILNDVLATDPNPNQPDDASLLAVKSLDAVGVEVDEPEHFRRAGVYQFNRYWSDARAHYERVKTTPNAAEALIEIGRGYAQEGDHGTAEPFFKQALELAAGVPDSKQVFVGSYALLQLASTYAREGNNEAAIASYQRFIHDYSSADKLDRAYLNIVDVYRDTGDDAKALEWCERTEVAFAGKTPEALAVFDEAKIYASRGEWQNEIVALDRLKGRTDLGGALQPGGTTAAEISAMRQYAVGKMAGSGGSISLDSAINKGSNADYPTPYAEVVVRRATAQGIDPRLLLSIMRQESKFDPQVRSIAAARGLMQFTHPQAGKVAGELGWTYFSDDELYSPEVSIALAVQYLVDLHAMFPGKTEAVVASYNGGEDNVKRWMARAKSDDPARYVPEFVFGQTKDYVQRVIANYRVYQQLYDEQLRPR